MKTNIKTLSFVGVATLMLCFVACKKSTPPTVKIYENISTSYTSANVTGEVTDEGSAPVTERGFIYGKQGEARQDTMYCGSGVGEFPTRIAGLEPNTTYNCFAFAENDGGVGTSGKVTFTTRDHDLPIATTFEVENVGTTTATCGGNVMDDGGADVTERGVCWSKNHNPTISGSHASAGSGLGDFSCNMTNLSANTTYYVRAYAKNSKGIGYGEEKNFTTLDFDLPEVTTAAVTDITQTSAKGGGVVTNDGGTTVTERGVCWSTSHNPTISGSHASSGTGIGTFTSDITGLSAHTIYYVRAYATNSKGTAYGDEVTFNTSANLPMVSTGSVTNITTTSATGNGSVTDDGGSDVTERGFCWSTNHAPTIGGQHVAAGNGTGNFTAAIANLTANTTYYVRAYATNGVGTAYGDEVEFTTLSISVPGVTTANVTDIGNTTATGGGNVISSGGAIVTERGICWSTSHNPTISGSHANSGTGTGEFTINMTGLTPNTTYYVKAYAINEQGMAYGEEVNFTTNAIGMPSVTTADVTNIAMTTATCGGNVTADGGATVTARGVCWSTSQNPTVSSSHTTDGSGTGSFTSSITGLTQNTTYYVRAYAINSAGTSYGEQKTFTTNSVNLPTVTTNSVTNVQQTTATCGGNVTNAGGGTVTARGVCWSTSQNPTISNSHTSNGTGTGSFTSSITGLSPNTTYYVRAYATNSAGTAYGTQRSFTTLSQVYVPTVTTNSVTNITQTSATCGGNVVNNGGATVTARGVCWSTSQNPTINNSHTSNGTGTGSFTSSITGLSPNTTYYVRAYATNSAGTGYGETRMFTTTTQAPTGAINGRFSVSAGQQVYFSQGNLQYKASSGTWRFATNQYDYIGSANSNISSSYSGWIDLFGWGTSGWNCGNTYYQPWDSNNSVGYTSLYGPPGNYNLTGSYVNSDWGYYNSISNGGNTTHQWRTLTQSEWDYVFNTRITTSGTRYAKAQVNNVNGVILLPDNWSNSYYSLYNTNSSGASFGSNVISSSSWTNFLEAHGAVFLPAAGCRYGTSVNDVGSYGEYWSASYFNISGAYGVSLYWANIYTDQTHFRSHGLSVRLVCPAQ